MNEIKYLVEIRLAFCPVQMQSYCFVYLLHKDHLGTEEVLTPGICYVGAREL